MNLRRVYRTCKILLLCAVLLLLVSGGATTWWLTTPHATNTLNKQIGNLLAAKEAPYRVSIASSNIKWTGESTPISVVLSDTMLSDLEGNSLIELPVVRVDFKLWKLLLLKLEPKRVTLIAPQLHLRKVADTLLLIGKDGHSITFPLKAGKEEGGQQSLPFIGLSIVDGQLTYEDALRNMRVSSSDLDLIWTHSGNRYHADFTAPLRVNDSALSIAGTAAHDEESEQGTIEVTLTDANPAQLCPLVTRCADIPVLDVNLSGTVAFHIGELSRLRGLAFSLSGSNGFLAFQPHLPETIALKSFEMSAIADEDLKHVNVKNILLDTGETTISANADLREEGAGYHVALDGEAITMPVDHLYRYWPISLAPDSRLWTITSIRGGMAEKATVSIRLKPEDFEPRFFPDKFLQSYIHVVDTSVDYIKGFPKAEKVEGIVRFTGETMVAETTKGETLSNSQITSSRIVFPDLNKEGTPVEIDLQLNTTAKDVLTFIAPPRFDFLTRLPVEASKAIGSVTGRIKLAFDAFSGDSPADGGINWDKVNYDIDATYADIKGITIQKQYSLEQGEGTFKANNQSLAASVKGRVNQAPLEANYQEAADKPTEYQIKTTLSKAQLKSFGAPDVEQLDGSLGIDAAFTRNGKDRQIDATIDLTPTRIDLSKLGYEKSVSTPAKLTLKSQPAGDVAVAYNAEGLKLAGTAKMTADNKLDTLRFSNIRLGQTNIGASYKQLQDGYELALQGKSLDLSQLYGDESSDATTISDFPPIRLKLDIDSIHMPMNQQITNAKGYLDCNQQRCEKADIRASLADGASMKLAIFNEGAQRKFLLESDNAGVLLKSFDISDRMQGGTFVLSGAYDDRKAGNPLDGKLVIEKFSLLNAPILGRILNMGSLGGLVETLSGKGMGFDRLRSDLVFVDDVASIKNGRAAGSSLGITAQGEINIGTHRLDLEGSLAPAYMINSFIGNIPLIGSALVGGEGEGIFAFNYSVKGDMDDPAVMVNPLSVLTPGFTRKFFDVFDTPPDTSKPKEAAPAAETPPPQPEKAPLAQPEPNPANAPKPLLPAN